MKILVTGGAGFIGSHLVGRLLHEGHEVIVLDTKPGTYAAKYIVGDIRDPDDVIKAAQNCDVVFHLAAITDVRNAHEEKIYDANFLGAKNVFDISNDNNIKVIFVSTAAVYGNAPVCMEDTPHKPLSQYGKSKLKAEKILKDGFILRLFNVYGPNGKSVINTFCRKIPEYESITIYGNGLQTRDYVHVYDVIDALILGINTTGTYNIGTGIETSLFQLIDIIQNISGCKPDIRFEMTNENEIERSRADITKIKDELGWKPKISLEEGIRDLLGNKLQKRY